jgi:surface protein
MSTNILNPFEIFGAAVDPDSFKYTNSVSALETITVPANGTNNFMLDPGDGTTPFLVTTPNPTHQYIDAGSYQISINGSMNSFRFGVTTASRLNVTSIDQMGNTGLTLITSFALNCINLTLINGDGFDSSGITLFQNFASGCTSLTTLNVSEWDMSSATDISSFARFDALLTTFDVSSWNTSSVTTIRLMLQGCTILPTFDVSNWDTSSLDSLFGAFLQARAIVTLNTNSWDTRLVTNCSRAFESMDDLTTSFDEFRWWNRTDDLTSGGTPDPIGTFTDCFKNSTNISNFASIPNNWKGL